MIDYIINLNMKWEYFIVNLNVESSSSEDLNIRDPETASEKLKGSLSPEFIKDQFPDQYASSDVSTDPCVQLKTFLNSKGEEGWELFESFKVGELFLLIMKRPLEK